MSELLSIATRLLIVTDDRRIRETVSHALHQVGFQLIAADNAAAAIEQCRQEAPALALVDQKLREGSGLQLAQQLNEIAPVPFILLTEPDDQAGADSALRQGALACAAKPIDSVQLVFTVRASLQHRRDSDDLRAQAAQLRDALQQGREISIAIGLLMARLHLTRDEAFERLRQHARSSRSRLEEVARGLVAHQDEAARVFRHFEREAAQVHRAG